MNKKIILLVFCILILQTGCERKLKTRTIANKNNEIIDVEITEKIDKEEEVVSNYTFYDELLNKKDTIGFLLSNYSSILQLDYEKLLIEFPEKYRTILDTSSQEYLDLIGNSSRFEDETVYKITKSNLQKFIKEKTSYAFDDFTKKNLSQIMYLSKYDSYYTTTTYDILPSKISVYKVSISKNTYYVYYKYNSYKYKLTMNKSNNNYYIVSNELSN